MDEMKLSPHFSLDELTRSSTAVRLSIDQTPPPAVLKALIETAGHMELVRALLGHPVRVNSGYRSKELNKAVGGSAKSAHVTGHAVDFTCPEYGTPKEVVRFLASCPNIQFDQLIYEGTWVHISFAPTLRREVLTAHFGPGGATYTQGVV
jgi:putative chitinase